ncbi:MAG: circularly permuted type 2 ATP-grasp protein, partial [Magnetococcus sp. WYHC-3]
PAAWVARERIVASTAPALVQGRLTHRPILLRGYLASDGERVDVLPGGLARASGAMGSNAFSPRHGGVAKDVWIVHERTLEPRPTVLQADFLDPAPLLGVPSRVAENLFWLGRYGERAEVALRLFREFLVLRSEETGLPAEERHYCQARILATFTHVTGTYPGFAGPRGWDGADPAPELRSALLDTRRPGSLVFSLRAMMQSTLSVRDRLSSDTWEVVDGLSRVLERLEQLREPELATVFWETRPLLQGLTAFSGLTWENMYRDLGWRFLDLGRRLERAMYLLRLLETALERPAEEASEKAMLERLLALNDSLAAFRMRFRTRLTPETVLEKLLQDDTDPRAVVYQLIRLERHAEQVPRGPHVTLYRTALGRVVLESLAATRLADPVALAVVDPATGRREGLLALTARIRQLLPLFSDTASNSYFRHADPPHHLFRSGGVG